MLGERSAALAQLALEARALVRYRLEARRRVVVLARQALDQRALLVKATLQLKFLGLEVADVRLEGARAVGI
jgi:hypothetical protein